MKSGRKVWILMWACAVLCGFGAAAVRPVSVCAQEVNKVTVRTAAIDGYSYGNYTYEVSSGAVTITGYSGSEKKLVIPAEIEKKPVTSIADHAISGTAALEVVIPDSVKTIEPGAFYYSYYITKVTVNGKNTLIGDNAFYAVTNITFVCSPDSKAYSYAKEHKAKISLEGGVSLSAAKITLGKTSVEQNSSEDMKVSVTVKLDGRTLKEGSDYVCIWPSDSERGTVGKKTVTVTAADYNSGNYTGSKSAYYNVVPARSAELSATKKITTSSIQLTWAKVNGASGYKIYRYNASSKKYKLIKTINKQSTSTYTDKGLKKNTSYKYRIIAYKKVGGNTYSSSGTELTASTDSGKTTVVKSSKKVKLETNTISLRTKVTTGGYVQNCWAQVSPVSDFIDSRGRYTVAYSSSKYVYINIMNNSSLKVAKTIKIKKKYDLVGSVAGGPDGNYYIVWGQSGWKSGTVVLAVSKYDKNGKYLKSCLCYNTGDAFDTATPFKAGNCAVTFQGNVLVCSYARQMLSAHQSNAIFSVNIGDMTRNTVYDNYVSHSFDQRVIARDNGDVVFANLGDGYPRGFELSESGPTNSWTKTPFHFYGGSGQNTTYARLGGIGTVSTGIALVGTSARSMTSKSKNERQQLFIQIVSPVTKKSILTGSKRSGTTCGYSAADTGIKWLTNYKNASVTASNMVVMEKDRILILWEKSSGSAEESWYMVVSATGKTLQKATRIGKVPLNECEEIKYKDGCIYWTTAAGKKSARVNKLYIGKFK